MSTTKYIQLEEDIKIYRPVMAKAMEAVLDQEVTKYPIFVIHQQEVEIGVKLIDAEQSGGVWTIHISTLEEFVSKQIVEEEKVDSFIEVFKSTDHYFCCFVLSELGANFVFIPRQ